MATRSPTLLMIRDELVGFARSKVMIVLWLLLPALGIGAFLLIDSAILDKRGDRPDLTATGFISILLSSIAGTIAALMVAVDIVSERQRKVYELFVIRPVPRYVIPLGKFVAVFLCVNIACLIALGLGLALDAARGSPTPPLREVAESLVNTTAVIAMACAIGVFFGVISRTILIAVILIQFGGQNLTVIPMLPVYFGVMPDAFWLIMALSFGIAFALVAAAIALFRKSEF